MATVLEKTGSLATPKDVETFLEKLSALAASPVGGLTEEDAAARALFDWERSFVVSRAPGRLDVMGGIADYSGSLVLQMPIAEAAHAALQLQLASPSAKKRGPPQLRVVSFGASEGGRVPSFSMPVAELFAGPGGTPTPLAELRAKFTAANVAWVAYVVGVIGVLLHEAAADAALAKQLEKLDLRPTGAGGLSIIISSDVPEGKGVSSSAAVEVATLMALLGATGGAASLMPQERIALLCQRAENLVVGAPCGVMDQMASALGRESMLLSLLCQPATLREAVPIPPSIRFWGVVRAMPPCISAGPCLPTRRHFPSHPIPSHPIPSNHITSHHITSHHITSAGLWRATLPIPSHPIPSHPIKSHPQDSGVRHFVGGSDYGTVRTAAWGGAV